MGASDNRRQTLEPLSDPLGSALLARIPLSIYLADARGRFAFCNAEARALLDLPAEGELARDTVGRFAHFWTSGETGKHFARFRLSQLEGYFRRDTAAVVDATVEHCASRALFETADKVRLMRRELASSAAEGA